MSISFLRQNSNLRKFFKNNYQTVFPFNKLLFFYLLHYSFNIFKYKKSHFTTGIQLLRLNVTQLSSLYSWTSTKCFPQDCYKNAEKNSLSFDLKSAKATLRPTFVMKEQCTSTSISLKYFQRATRAWRLFCPNFMKRINAESFIQNLYI